MNKVIIIYLVAVNLIAFIVYGLDKLQAKRGGWRISESTLLWLAAAGGSVGALTGMQTWRHKTLHKKFTLGVPAILLVQLALIVWLCVK